MKRIRSIIQRFKASQSGASAIEFAMIASFLSIVLLNIVDIAIFMYNKMGITSAVRAGAQYVLVARSNATTALIQGVIQDATNLSPLSVTVDSNLCGCSDGTTFVCETKTCGTGGTSKHVYYYTSLGATYTHAWIFWPGTSNINVSTQIRTD